MEGLGGDVCGFDAGVVEDGPGGDADGEEEGVAGRDVVGEEVGEGVVGGACDVDFVVAGEGGVEFRGAEEGVDDAVVGAGVEPGVGDVFGEAGGEADGAAGVVGFCAEGCALRSDVPEGKAPGQRLGDRLVRLGDVLMCPPERKDHGWHGVVGCHFSTIGERAVTEGLVEIIERIHGLNH